MRDFHTPPQPVPLPVQAATPDDTMPVTLLQLTGDGARMSSLSPDRIPDAGGQAALRGPQNAPHVLKAAGRP
jgi:hypothetical protein